MGGANWSELFPSRKSVFIFLSYMSLFVAQGKRTKTISRQMIHDSEN